MILEFVILFVVLTLALYGYLHIARKKQILDLPNHRSSHQQITIRGGGIVVPIAILIFWSVYQQYHFFVLGTLLISGISFVDDIKPLPSRVRLLIHFLAVSLLFFQLDLWEFQWFILPVAFVLVIGWINAMNFMDGINGITVAYSLVTAGTLWFMYTYQVSFVNNELLEYSLIALVVFAMFNFRKRALCFAGDIGSVSIAFILSFILVSLIITTGKVGYLGFLLIYAIDSVGTIIERLLKRENIFEPHRLHFYQRLANDRKIPHLIISSGYALLQLGINMIVIHWAQTSIFQWIILSLLITLSILYVISKQILFKIL
ncbi:MAG: UDP-GlcNAc--UDP-phosphate GlcNAc-1-phosphate transferase [Rickettsiales bacterium]|nr:UDP-GlcNAc--UDP-phosphate GlcNAc-1-phosphate transferase [Rickettsiales bacterium]